MVSNFKECLPRRWHIALALTQNREEERIHLLLVPRWRPTWLQLGEHPPPTARWFALWRLWRKTNKRRAILKKIKQKARKWCLGDSAQIGNLRSSPLHPRSTVPAPTRVRTTNISLHQNLPSQAVENAFDSKHSATAIPWACLRCHPHPQQEETALWYQRKSHHRKGKLRPTDIDTATERRWADEKRIGLSGKGPWLDLDEFHQHSLFYFIKTSCLTTPSLFGLRFPPKRMLWRGGERQRYQSVLCPAKTAEFLFCSDPCWFPTMHT